MIKIHAKLIKRHKTIKNVTYINLNEYDRNNFYDYLTAICRELEISTPIVIPYFIECYENFNSVRFSKEDFVDTVDFDYLFLENIDR